MQDAYRVTAEELRAFVERIERLEDEKSEIAANIKDVYAEAKMRAYDTKTLRKLIALRKKDSHTISEEEAVLQLYIETLYYVEARGM